MVFVFALGSFSLLNASTTKSNGVTEKIAVTEKIKDCWADADLAEKDFCGSVGCSYDFWAGYYEGCKAGVL